jgi:HTH-type transcriptional regulator/antitoxin MqsA
MSESLLEGYLHRRCGGRYASATETVTVRVIGMAPTVERALFRCDRCGDERRTVEQRESAEQAAVAEMRQAHALLAPKEIRQLRERLGLTTQQLGDLLYGIPRGVVEGWERGRYLQNPQVDALLRSLEDRETLEQRAAKAGVALPVPEDPNAPAPAAEGSVEGSAPAPSGGEAAVDDGDAVAEAAGEEPLVEAGQGK